jgi:4,5-DOPA dioxygenase extradiol
MADPTPAIFVSHGAPPLYLEPQATRTFLLELGRALPRPRAVVCVSAHWTTPEPMVTMADQPETIHDFSGFPRELYAVRYPAPGDPGLAERVIECLHDAGIAATGDPRRGLDHGAWAPLHAPLGTGGPARLLHDHFTYGVLSMAAFAWE